MTGYMIAWGNCLDCGRMFAFNPDLVPSSSVLTGEREPICRSCVERLNVIRKARGMEPIRILPGAYEPGEHP